MTWKGLLILKIVAFVGSSGTGKSYRAMWVARENGINYIIDDGLLIKGNRVIAGYSAKKEKTRLASVRRALFIDPYHAEQVKRAITGENPSGILILGTSLNMVQSIVKTLGLPSLSQIVYIEDVAAPDEIEMAKTMRTKEGKHVIPVPTFEIKKDFSGYFLDPLKIFRRRHKNEQPFIADKSVVRPTFSYMGEYTISDQVIYTISKHEALTVASVTKLNRMWMQNKPTGLVIHLTLTLKYGYTLPAEAAKVQRRVKQALEKYTGLNVLQVHIEIRHLIL